MLVGVAGSGDATGYRLHPHPFRHITNAVVRTSAANGRVRLRTAAALPTKYDLRNVDGASCLSPIRDQGRFGTCWAFASMAGIEWQMRRGEGIDADLSENNLANMHGFAIDYRSGGTHEMAMAVFLREDGPVTEALDPYHHIGASVRERGVRIPRKVVFVPVRTSVSNASQMQADLDALKRAILEYGPLATSYADDAQYKNGAAYYCNVAIGCNHAVSIIGWDDSYSAANFRVTPPGDGAFIIRNSWGTGWYESGYMYISYYDRTLGFGDVQVAYVSLSKGDDYGHLYQHDFHGCVNIMGCGSETAYAANVFVARASETLTAFGFYAMAENTSYSAFIVRDPGLPGDDIVGNWIPVKEGICHEAGYEVIPFDTPVAVSNAETFAIIVKLTVPNVTKPIPVCCNDSFSDGTPYVTNVESVAGLSLVCKDPEQYYWEDNSARGKYFCCKVYAAPRGGASCTTTTDTPVPYGWLDNYAALQATDYFLRYYCGCYNALAEHVAANGLSVAASFEKGLDPDSAATETNLTATISFDAFGIPVIGVTPKNTSLWNYTVLGSDDLRGWHGRTATDRFFKVSVQPK